MTDKGTFIINGTERVVVSQLIRSPGVYFEAPTDRATGRPLAMAKLIPDRGAWMEFETRKNDYIILKFNRKRTVPITVFLRALAAVDDGIKDSPVQDRHRTKKFCPCSRMWITTPSACSSPPRCSRNPTGISPAIRPSPKRR